MSGLRGLKEKSQNDQNKEKICEKRNKKLKVILYELIKILTPHDTREPEVLLRLFSMDVETFHL